MGWASMFNPSAPQPQGQNPGQDTFEGLKTRWDGFMSDPRNVSALLSIGGALAQPQQFGQTGFGHVMGALGAGGESVRTNEALDIKKSEADSKASLRESQAQLAESRAQTAGAGSTVAAQRLELQRQGNEDKNARNQLQNVLRFQRMYHDQVKALQTLNTRKALLGEPAATIPSFKEWAANSPQISSMLGLSSQDVGAAGADEPAAGPTDIPAAATPAVLATDPNEGRTQTNRATGEKQIWRNGRWQRL